MTLTPQEEFWAGPAGDAYTQRNDEALLPSKTAFFRRTLGGVGGGLRSVLEFGANRGLNLVALKSVYPDADVAGVEINQSAAEELTMRLGPQALAYRGSILDSFLLSETFDLVLSMGLLIHLPPEDLPKAYDELYAASARYVLIAEYFNPTPVEIRYRREMGRLWKRDFASEMLDRFPDLRVVDYGFVWRRDPNAPLDDLNWFLLEKQA